MPAGSLRLTGSKQKERRKVHGQGEFVERFFDSISFCLGDWCWEGYNRGGCRARRWADVKDRREAIYDNETTRFASPRWSERHRLRVYAMRNV